MSLTLIQKIEQLHLNDPSRNISNDKEIIVVWKYGFAVRSKITIYLIWYNVWGKKFI